MEPPLEQFRCDTPPGVYVLVPKTDLREQEGGRGILSRTILSGGVPDTARQDCYI